MNHWGRIFFFYDDKDRLIGLKGQPLENHTANCLKIAERFHPSFFHPQSDRKRLLSAVALHDQGKKETFRIRPAEERNGKKPVKAPVRFAYSFAGHRFRVPDGDPYIIGLIRSHHEYSIEQINREKSRLSAADQKTFADDLYLLCMADQIEAEISVRAIEGKAVISRTFMEFTTCALDGDALFSVVPWPFEPDAFEMDFDLKAADLSAVKKMTPEAIQKILVQNEHSDERITVTLRRE